MLRICENGNDFTYKKKGLLCSTIDRVLLFRYHINRSLQKIYIEIEKNCAVFSRIK